MDTGGIAALITRQHRRRGGSRSRSEETIRVHRKRLTQTEKRIGELDRLFLKIYEDNANSKLSDERFAMISKTYEDEQTELKAEVKSLQQEIEVQERQIENLEQFIQRIRSHTELAELTLYALRELVRAIYVEAPDKSSGKRRQKVHIEYDLVGFIPVDTLIKRNRYDRNHTCSRKSHVTVLRRVGRNAGAFYG